MKVQYIEILVAIADAGSLRAAAQALGKSQPALTKSLRLAEEDLGIQLFHRSSRGVTPTKLGERVLARARSINSELGRLDDEVRQLQGAQVGTVNVCLSPFGAVRVMPRALTLFRRTYPEVKVAMTSGLFPGALKPLREGRTDIVIGPAPPAELTKGIVVEPLLEMPIAVVTSVNSEKADARSLAELSDAQWIMIGSPGGPGDIFRKPFEQHGFDAPEALTSSESYFGALSLVESMGAVCTFPKLLLEDLGKNWSITEINIVEKIEPVKIALLTRVGHPLTPAADHLVNCVRRRAQTLRQSI